MANNVDITIAGDSRAAEQALEKLNSQMQKMELRVEKMRTASKIAAEVGKRGFDAQSESLGQLTVKAAEAIAAYGSMRIGIQAIGDEWENTKRKQEAARVAPLHPAQAIREAKLAIEDDRFLSSKNLEQKALEISGQTRAKVETVASVIGEASSAKGDLTNREVLDATRQALRIDPAKPEQAAVLAARMLDLAKVSGTADMRVNAGFMQNLGQASRVKNFEFIGANLIPSINSLARLGDSHEEAGELVSTMTQLMGEEEGRISATASLQLGQQLKDFFLQPETKGKLKGQLVAKDQEGEFVVPQGQFDALRAAGSTQERMNVMRESPELRRAFLAQSSFETKAKESVFALLRGEASSMAALSQAQGVIRGTQSAEDRQFQSKLFETKIAEYESGQFQKMLTAEQRREVEAQHMQLQNINSQRIADARKTIEETLNLVDLPGLDESPPGTFGLFGQREPLMAAFDSTMKATEQLLAEGKTVKLTPEEVAARMLKKVPREGLTGDLSPEHAQFIDQRVQSLMATGRANGSLTPMAGPDPEMQKQNQILAEQTQVLRQILDRASRNAPQQTERNASRLSRRGEK